MRFLVSVFLALTLALAGLAMLFTGNLAGALGLIGSVIAALMFSDVWAGVVAIRADMARAAKHLETLATIAEQEARHAAFARDQAASGHVAMMPAGSGDPRRTTPTHARAVAPARAAAAKPARAADTFDAAIEAEL